MKIFCDCLFSENIIDFPTTQSKQRGLSGLAERILGKPLDKKEQISDWTKRPLKSSQITYAALGIIHILRKHFGGGGQKILRVSLLSVLERQ